MIIAVKDAIKPGFIQMYFKEFTPDLVKTYLSNLKKQKILSKKKALADEREAKRVNKILKKKISTDLEMNINTHLFLEQQNNEIEREKDFIKKQLITKQAGPRHPVKREIFLDMAQKHKEQEYAEMKRQKQKNMITDAVFKNQRSIVMAEDDIPGLDISENRSVSSFGKKDSVG